ncbi:uncharacterized protein LOC132703843 isoform X2 [Cylas formicarius]|uniref:uncharacterized protein LOC132703843 isoform X2 n=1 Tax=Cylas formicarius TaxID=197179 RepID=UPI0029589C8F|nr:uncharacterized protein LOC132703843 isoform X2 [Cylas formicarius]
MDIDSNKNQQFFSFSSDPFSVSLLQDGYQTNLRDFDRVPPNDLFENSNHIFSSIGVFDWSNEKILHADLSSIPSEMLCSSPKDKGGLPKVIWENWQNKIAISLEELSSVEDTQTKNFFDVKYDPLENSVSSNQSKRERKVSDSSDILNTSFHDLAHFDIAQYVLGDVKDEHQQADKNVKCDSNVCCSSDVISKAAKSKAGVKKIDLKAQRYITEDEEVKKTLSDNEDDVDIETVSDNENSPVLEAGDLTSLLEQFEATEEISLNSTNLHIDSSEENTKKQQSDIDPNSESTIGKSNFKVKEKKQEVIQPTHIENFDNRIECPILSKNTEGTPKLLFNQTDANSCKMEAVASGTFTGNSSKKQVLDYLPQEVIDRIRESGKRKPITVIEPIANCRRGVKNQNINTHCISISNVVYLDHNYCGSLSYLSKKDSGFHSAEEDDRNTRRQFAPNNERKSSLSVLKANINQNSESSRTKKKILNLEEYKKRRKHVFNSNNSSLASSPMESGCNSPQPEDETQKMLRHQEKLRKMAKEVLIAAPKCASTSLKNSTLNLPPLLLAQEALETVTNSETVRPVHLKVPENLERKVLVSFGVNTDFKMSKHDNPLAPVEKLQEIKPLLEKVSDKIKENSFINSLIENIPKIITKKEKASQPEILVEQDVVEHGENKQVLHLEKSRPRVETNDVETQTDISLIYQCKRGRTRKRDPSISSDSSGRSDSSSYQKRSRKRSSESSTSSSSSNSYTSFSPIHTAEAYSRLSYNRSRSRSPRRNGRNQNNIDREHLNAVEERRIIYVGRIKQGTSKDDLRSKFKKFGPITNISLHFRDQGYNHLENYGFVTFKYKEDAHEAYEHGNDDKKFPTYKISFGGRREFCKSLYSDLDNMRDDQHYQSHNSYNSFDQLLKEAQEKLKKRRV